VRLAGLLTVTRTISVMSAAMVTSNDPTKPQGGVVRKPSRSRTFVKRRALERHVREHSCRFVGERGRHAKWRALDGSPATVPEPAATAPRKSRKEAEDG
jgi:hypothetical protein